MTATAPDKDDCIAYWAFEDLTDDSGNSNTLTNDGASSGSTGILDDCYTFNGTSDTMYAADVCDGTATKGAISVWFKTSSTAATQTVCGYYNDSDTSDISGRVLIYLGNISTAYSDESISLQVRSNSVVYTTATIRKGANYYNDGEWHHAYFGSTGSAYIFYMDGDDVSSDVTYHVGSNDGNWLSLSNDGTDFLIGARIKDNSEQLWIDGELDELALFDSTPSGDIAEYLYNSGSPGSAQQYPFGSTTVGNHALYMGCNF